MTNALRHGAARSIDISWVRATDNSTSRSTTTAADCRRIGSAPATSACAAWPKGSSHLAVASRSARTSLAASAFVRRSPSWSRHHERAWREALCAASGSTRRERRQPPTAQPIESHRWRGGNNLIRVMLVDDHAVVRVGFRLLLQACDDIEVIGEADSGEQALQLLGKAGTAVTSSSWICRCPASAASRRCAGCVRVTLGRACSCCPHTRTPRIRSAC